MVNAGIFNCKHFNFIAMYCPKIKHHIFHGIASGAHCKGCKHFKEA